MEELRKELKKQFIKPFKFIPEAGYIFDSNNQMVGEVRGWGHLSKFPNADKLQDELGEMLSEGLNIVFEQQLSKQVGEESWEKFKKFCFDNLPNLELIEMSEIFEHYILIPKENNK